MAPDDLDATSPDEPVGTSAEGDRADGRVTVGKARTPISQQVGRVTMIAAGGVFVLFALFNARYVDFSWVFGSTEVVMSGGDRVSGGVPLIVLLVAAFVLGGIVGAGAVRRRRKP